MDIINRIQTLCNERKWTEYKLSKESGIAQSTLSNLIHRGNTPAIMTLLKICNAFNITIGEFFEEDDLKDIKLKKILKNYYQMNECQKYKLLLYSENIINRST